MPPRRARHPGLHQRLPARPASGGGLGAGWAPACSPRWPPSAPQPLRPPCAWTVTCQPRQPHTPPASSLQADGRHQPATAPEQPAGHGDPPEIPGTSRTVYARP